MLAQVEGASGMRAEFSKTAASAVKLRCVFQVRDTLPAYRFGDVITRLNTLYFTFG